MCEIERSREKSKFKTNIDSSPSTSLPFNKDINGGYKTDCWPIWSGIISQSEKSSNFSGLIQLLGSTLESSARQAYHDLLDAVRYGNEHQLIESLQGTGLLSLRQFYDKMPKISPTWDGFAASLDILEHLLCKTLRIKQTLITGLVVFIKPLSKIYQQRERCYFRQPYHDALKKCRKKINTSKKQGTINSSTSQLSLSYLHSFDFTVNKIQNKLGRLTLFKYEPCFETWLRNIEVMITDYPCVSSNEYALFLSYIRSVMPDYKSMSINESVNSGIITNKPVNTGVVQPKINRKKRLLILQGFNNKRTNCDEGNVRSLGEIQENPLSADVENEEKTFKNLAYNQQLTSSSQCKSHVPYTNSAANIDIDNDQCERTAASASPRNYDHEKEVERQKTVNIVGKLTQTDLSTSSNDSPHRNKDTYSDSTLDSSNIIHSHSEVIHDKDNFSEDINHGMQQKTSLKLDNTSSSTWSSLSSISERVNTNDFDDSNKITAIQQTSRKQNVGKEIYKNELIEVEQVRQLHPVIKWKGNLKSIKSPSLHKVSIVENSIFGEVHNSQIVVVKPNTSSRQKTTGMAYYQKPTHIHDSLMKGEEIQVVERMNKQFQRKQTQSPESCSIQDISHGDVNHIEECVTANFTDIEGEDVGESIGNRNIDDDVDSIEIKEYNQINISQYQFLVKNTGKSPDLQRSECISHPLYSDNKQTMNMSSLIKNFQSTSDDILLLQSEKSQKKSKLNDAVKKENNDGMCSIGQPSVFSHFSIFRTTEHCENSVKRLSDKKYQKDYDQENTTQERDLYDDKLNYFSVVDATIFADTETCKLSSNITNKYEDSLKILQSDKINLQNERLQDDKSTTYINKTKSNLSNNSEMEKTPFPSRQLNTLHINVNIETDAFWENDFKHTPVMINTYLTTKSQSGSRNSELIL
ncbi:unnamed protein product [Trichobilharzia szidati]|nr:unnamed protein product [Trichobilharzia szidati]